MAMHDECVEGNFRSIDILREANIKQAARPRLAQVNYCRIHAKWNFLFYWICNIKLCGLCMINLGFHFVNDGGYF